MEKTKTTQKKRTLDDHLGHFNSMLNVKTVCITKSRNMEIQNALQSLNLASHKNEKNYKDSDFSTFMNRLRDNQENEVFSDSRKLKFLPKCFTSEVYKVIERVAGCSYKAIMEILHTETQLHSLLLVLL